MGLSKAELVASGEYIVRKLSKGYPRHRLDLAAAGRIGLVKAADGYDSSRGVAFATYAYRFVAGEMAEEWARHQNCEAEFEAACTPSGEDIASWAAIPSVERLNLDRLRAGLEPALEQLDVWERAILTLQYGLDGDEPMTPKAIGGLMGVTRQRVSALEKRARKKLQEALDQEGGCTLPDNPIEGDERPSYFGPAPSEVVEVLRRRRAPAR